MKVKKKIVLENIADILVIFKENILICQQKTYVFINNKIPESNKIFYII